MPFTTPSTPLTACDVPTLSVQWEQLAQAFLAKCDSHMSTATLERYHRELSAFLVIHQPDQATAGEIEAFIARPSQSYRHRHALPSNSTCRARRCILQRYYAFIGLGFPLPAKAKEGVEHLTLPTTVIPDSAWDRCIAQFLQEIYARSGSAQSLRQYTGILRAFFSTSANDGPPKPPDHYTREDVLWFVHRSTNSPRSRGKPPSASTINARQATIASFYHFASGYTYLDSSTGHITTLYDHASPTAGLSFRKAARSYRAMSFDELERFFAVIPRDTVKGLRDRAIFLLYLHTARRRMEIANLRWGDLQEGMIVDAGGMRRLGWLYHFRGKGRSTIDDVCELPAPAKEVLDRYLLASGRMVAMRPDSPLFTSDYHALFDERPLRACTIERMLKSYVKLAGLDAQRITLHSFRHSAAHERFSAGEDIRSIQRLLRHSNLATTDVYLSQLMGSADEGAKLVEGKFRGL